MSKSLGNFYTLRDLLKKGYSGLHVRYLLLSTHYRTQLNFTMQGLDAAKASLRRIEDFVLRLRRVNQERGEGVEDLLSLADDRFFKALSEDLNISSALAALFDLLREINMRCDANSLSSEDARSVLALFKRWDEVLGLAIMQEKDGEIPSELNILLDRRETARREKNYAASDQIRNEIFKQGYVIEDTPSGARLKKR
jgi:cysteinyl-tRNA synthetase